MKRFVLFVVMVLMFGFINVNKGECKVIKTENVNVIGESYSYNEAGMMWYGLKVDGKDILIGPAYELSESISQCLDNNSKVRLQGKMNTIEEKGSNGKVVYRGKQFDTKTVKCSPVK